MNEDERLRALFGRARNRDATGLPGFAAVVSRRQGPGVQATGASLVLLALAALVTFSTTEPPQRAVSIAEWRSPTAFLLETTGNALLRDLPEIGPINEEDLP